MLRATVGLAVVFLVCVGVCSSAAAQVTFELAASQDDAISRVGGVVDSNFDTSVWCLFGNYEDAGVDYTQGAYMRYALDIPRASRITASNFSFTNRVSKTGIFNATIYGLAKDNKWEGSNGFDQAHNYGAGTDLDAIPAMSATAAWNSVAAWPTVDAVYDSPDISDVLQVQVDILAGSNRYDPTDSEDKYVGYRISDDTGDYSDGSHVRNFYSYDNGSKSPELDATFEAWGAVRTGNGMKYNSGCDCYKYYDH